MVIWLKDIWRKGEDTLDIPGLTDTTFEVEIIFYARKSAENIGNFQSPNLLRNNSLDFL